MLLSWKFFLSILLPAYLPGSDVSKNQFAGGLPPSLGTLPALNSLDVSENQFEGAVPPSYAKVQKFK